jgi:aminopeptidase-like protein
MIEDQFIKKNMWKWSEDLFPVCRSITGPGVRKTLNYLKKIVPNLKIFNIRSGKKVFDWRVPYEWQISEAYILDHNKKKIIDFKKNNLHVVGYSEPVNKKMKFIDLNKHIHSLPKMPNSIPYVTSYYKKTWGFCITQKQRSSLKKNKKYFQVVIKSKLKKGFLNYGEIIIPGLTKKEIFLSTYICHPSLANNELSGPVVTTAIAKWINNLKNPYYTYRIIFIPETIGSIIYIKKNLTKLKKNVVAGFVVTCVGDNNSYSYLESKFKNTLSDRASLKALETLKLKYKKFNFLEHRGSDERQYSSPGVDLPFCSLMRTKYGEYKEYHTSKDNLSFISPDGLFGGYNLLKTAIQILEINKNYIATNKCEPQLSKKDLKSSLGGSKMKPSNKILANILAYANGKTDLIEMSNIFKKNIFLINDKIQFLKKMKLIKIYK